MARRWRFGAEGNKMRLKRQGFVGQVKSLDFIVSIKQSHLWYLSRDGGYGCSEGKVDGSRRETRKLLRRSRGGTMVAWTRMLAVAAGDSRWRQQGS